MNSPPPFDTSLLPAAVIARIDEVCDRFERAWESGLRPRIEDYLEAEQEPERSALLYQLLSLEVECRETSGDSPVLEEYSARFPERAEVLQRVFAHVAASTARRGTPVGADSKSGNAGPPPAPDAMAHRGTFGHFGVLGLLGRGAFGSVYRAKDRRLDRDVALKIPRAGAFDDPSDAERFSREARAAAQLRHPHIVPVYEAGEIEGTQYIASHFVDGKTLREHIQEGRRFENREAAALIAKLAAALHYAHSKGVIHRDVKPANVILDAADDPQIADFGLARREQADATRTREGQCMGTPAYMSPEQASGRSHLADGRSDLWSLGVMLYELLTLRRPFSGEEADVLRKIRDTEPDAPRRLDKSIPKDLETICLKCLAKEPGDRYPSCQHLADDLQRFCAGEPIRARRQSPLVRLWRGVARRPVVSGLIAAALLVMALGGYLLARGQRERQVTELMVLLDRDFDAGDWSPEALGTMDARIERLSALAPDQAEVAEERLVQRFAAAIRERISSGNLSRETMQEIETELGLLEPRDPDAAAALRREYDERARKWQIVFDLSVPFATLSDVFDSGEVQVDGDAMRRTAGDQGSGTTPTLFSRVKCAEAVQLEALFDVSWEDAQEIGLELCAEPGNQGQQATGAGSSGKETMASGGESGYRFVLRARPPRDDTAPARASMPRTMASARAGKGKLTMEILRNGVQLQVSDFPASDIPKTRPLRLRASRCGDELRWQVGDRPEVVFWDPLAYRGQKGVFALRWPAKVRVTKLHAAQLAWPNLSSDLEHGDRLFAGGRYAEALSAYEKQNQAPATKDKDVAQQARYKAALCLLKMERTAQAERLLTELAAEPEKRWPTLAIFELWLRAVRQERFKVADDCFATLAGRFWRDASQLARLIPSELQNEILEKYVNHGRGINLYRPSPTLVPRAERAEAIAEFFDSTGTAGRLGVVRSLLLRAYCATGNEEKALERAETWKQDGRLDGVNAAQYSWLLRIKGRPKDALSFLEGPVRDAKSANIHWLYEYLLIERARVLAALEQWDEAEKSIDDFLLAAPSKEFESEGVLGYAVLGFLRERRKDVNGAQEAWKMGLNRRYDRMDPLSGMRFLNGWILSSLTNQVSEFDAKALMDRILAAVSSDSTIGMAGTQPFQGVSAPDAVREALCESFRTERGRNYARKIVLQEVPFADCVQVPARLFLFTVLHRGAMPKDLSEEQDRLLWNLTGDLYDAAITRGTLGEFQLIPLGLAWKGTSGPLGWAGVAPSLEQRLRAQLAYVLGHRYLRLNQPKDARTCFETAVKDAPADLPLAKTEAQKELNRLPPNS